MMRGLGIIVAVGLAPLPVSGQTLTVSEVQIRACADNAPAWEGLPQCVTDAANDCQTLPGGSTTIGIVDCLSAETAVWDAILNEEYAKARSLFDDVGGEDLTISLRDAQRAWIAFRDADCAMRYQRWIGGTIRSVVSASCQLTMTASRALALRDLARNTP